MKICAAQARPVKGDIQRNIENHKRLIALAVSNKADIIIFPELSLTGYEPELAKELATDPDDNRFDDFQEISDADHVTIGVGMPVKSNEGILVSMLIFQPGTQRQIYSKQHLHADEYPYFVNGKNPALLIENNISFAICYELSLPEHSQNAFKIGTEIYIASVAKTADGVGKASKSLSAIAGKYSMTVVMSNCVGYCDNFESGGKSSIWNNKGSLAGQLNDIDEGLIIIDTGTQEITEVII